jgi:hypothetical protein
VKKKKGTKKVTRTEVLIPAPNIKDISITLSGITPLLVNQISAKAKEELKGREFGVGKIAKAPRDAKAEYESSLYRIPGKRGVYGMPASGIKHCGVKACKFVGGGLKASRTMGAFHVLGLPCGLVPIKGSAPVMDERYVRIGNFPRKTPSPRYRGRFDRWEVTFRVRYNANILTPSQLLNLYDHGGFSVGLCEWRPEKNGQMGMFEVKRG